MIYIFAVDISSSMQPYQGVVLQNLQRFVDALPNGDQITIIRMADENYTDYVNHAIRFYLSTPDKLMTEVKRKADILNWIAVQCYSFFFPIR